MSLFKCKMCGGTLEISGNETVGTCEYCGTQQTLPKLNDDRRANLYDRANHFRRNNEFDKAMGIYEQILNEDTTDAEAYWSLVLCRYGIEYVEDPTTHKRVPTVNRAQYTSIFDDDNYKLALQYADGYQQHIYKEEADTINEIQKGILAISQKEEPFDVFICYKETDRNGRRTPDSVLANDLYHQLTHEGFKVFFSRITLEDKLGVAYEPYIFAALNSAKVMVVVGTKSEYYNAVWVKNEWSRYLSLIRGGAKKVLIPAYRDMDPYDLPEEFSHLQAQDMSKLGFMQDLIRGVKKIIQTAEPKIEAKETVVVGSSINTAPLLRRAFMFLEDGEWDNADEYCEKVLDIEPENAQAYLGKLMAELQVRNREDLKNLKKPFDGSNNYRKVIRFADDTLVTTLVNYISHINTQAEIARKDSILSSGKGRMGLIRLNQVRNPIADYEYAISLFTSIPGWKDADECLLECRQRLEELKAEQEAERIERERQAELTRQESERQAELARIAAKKKANRIKILIAVGAVILLAITIATQIITSSPAYIAKKTIKEGFEYYQSKEFSKAFSTWQKVGQAPVDTNKTYAPGVVTSPAADSSSAGYTPTNEELLAYGEDLFYEYARYIACRSFNDAIPLFELILDYQDSADIVTEMKLLLDKYVGEYACISNVYQYVNGNRKGDIEKLELEGNFTVTDFRYANNTFSEIDPDYSFQGLFQYPYGEYFRYDQSKEKLYLIVWDYPYDNEFTFSADGSSFTAITTFDGDKGNLVYTAVWEKIS